MGPSLQKLCVNIVGDVYGDFYGLIFSQLVRYGRLTSFQIAHKSRLPIRQVKSGLAALTQLRLVYHHTSGDGASTFQANLSSAYDLLRSGKLIELAERYHGATAAAIVETACLLGFATITEIKARVLEDLPLTHQTNGTGLAQEALADQKGIDQTLDELIEDGFLTNMKSVQLQTWHDARDDVERELKRNGMIPKSVTGTKAKAEIDERLDAEVRRLLDTAIPEVGYVDTTPHKRRRDTTTDLTEEEPAQKRRKTGQSMLTNGNSGNGNHIICANYRKVASTLRRNYLLATVKKELGHIPSVVLQCAFTQTSRRQETNGLIDVRQLRVEINEMLEKEDIIGEHRSQRPENGLNTQRRPDLLSYGDVEDNLALIAEAPFKFLSRTSATIGGSWFVDETVLDTLVQEREILRLMTGGVSSSSLRILKMLIDKGKLEEKTLQELGLLGAKELRQNLSQMKQLGYVDLQEVPREPQRQPTRTLFLWFYDSERVQQVLLESLYKAMTRIIQRAQLGREKFRPTLEKLERADVRGKEEEALVPAELEALRRWRKTETWLMGEVERLDDSVLVLKDSVVG